MLFEFQKMILILTLILVFAVSAARLDKTDKNDTSDDMSFYWRRSNSRDCNPFTTYKVECNKCVCGADSISYCTRMECPKKGYSKRKPEQILTQDADEVESHDKKSFTSKIINKILRKQKYDDE